jgi:cytidine deaminase
MRTMLTGGFLFPPISKVLVLGLCLLSFPAQRADQEESVHKPILTPDTVGNLLSQFSTAARQRLETVLFNEHFDGVLESGVINDVLRLEANKITVDQLMVDMLPLARLYSVPETSGFKVGAVCQGVSGNIYFGANLELAGTPLGFTIHAEQSAIANALAHGEKSVRLLAVTSAPCGHCRQFLNELTTASSLQVLIAGKPKTSLTSLLPDSFGPADLGVKGCQGRSETRPLGRRKTRPDECVEDGDWQGGWRLKRRPAVRCADRV